jgi:hypothetical protein
MMNHASGELRDAREVVREEMLMKDRIVEVMLDGPKTIPEIAQALGYTGYEVMYWVMAMRKYNYVAETEEATDEGYYRYTLTEKGGPGGD